MLVGIAWPLDLESGVGIYDADKDILDQYLHEVSKTSLLSAQQEVAIARKVRAGDAVIGINPASDNVEQVSALLRMLDEIGTKANVPAYVETVKAGHGTTSPVRDHTRARVVALDSPAAIRTAAITPTIA
mgnify:CR=1 FL=1